jgi:hypothetical protein
MVEVYDAQDVALLLPLPGYPTNFPSLITNLITPRQNDNANWDEEDEKEWQRVPFPPDLSHQTQIRTCKLIRPLCTMTVPHKGDGTILRFLGCNSNHMASEDILTWL